MPDLRMAGDYTAMFGDLPRLEELCAEVFADIDAADSVDGIRAAFAGTTDG